jgi:hypothetical protein
VTVWQSDHPEDFVGPQGIRMGCGWVQEHPDFGMVAVDHEQEAYAVLPDSSQRALRLEDSRAKRLQAEEDAAAEERAMARAFRWRSLGYSPTSMAERFAVASRRMDSEDRREEARVRAGLASGELEVQPRSAPALRSEQFEMRREQAQRKAAEASRDVKGSDLDALRGEVLQLRAKLSAHGIR